MAIEWRFLIGDTELTVHGMYRDGKPKMAFKMIVEAHSVTYVNAAGKLYSSRVGHSSRSYGRRWQGHVALIREAIALGVLPKGNTLKVAAIEERRRQMQNAAYSAKDTLRSAESAGVTLPANVVRKLKHVASFVKQRS